MGGSMFQNTDECSGFDRGMHGNDRVILAVRLCGDADFVLSHLEADFADAVERSWREPFPQMDHC